MRDAAVTWISFDDFKEYVYCCCRLDQICVLAYCKRRSLRRTKAGKTTVLVFWRVHRLRGLLRSPSFICKWEHSAISGSKNLTRERAWESHDHDNGTLSHVRDLVENNSFCRFSVLRVQAASVTVATTNDRLFWHILGVTSAVLKPCSHSQLCSPSTPLAW